MENIRIAQEKDLDDVFEIQRKCIIHPWNRTMFEDTVKQETSEIYVFEIDNVIVGYILIKVTGEEAEILSIAVKPEYRGQGIATRILETSIKNLKEEEVIEILLEVRSLHIKTIALYEKMGFCNISVRKKYYHDPVDDAQIMIKKL